MIAFYHVLTLFPSLPQCPDISMKGTVFGLMDLALIVAI